MLKYKKMILFLLVNNFIISQNIEDPFNNSKILKYRLFHTPPKPLFISQTHFLDFVTDIPKDSVDEAILFFKTNNMDNYREFSLLGTHGLYRFKYDPKIYPGKSIQYYFVLKSGTNIYATPLNSKGKLVPINKRFLDPVQYYKQRARMNR
tara:strand:- start:1381 stop:1830 length:450 start_codon:yes stop_codon:yes gene_type:complete